MTTVYIAGIYERQGAAAASYYEGGGLRRSGYTSNNGVFYMLSDHLKSTSALVARNGVLNVKYFYYPYGARRGVPFNSITARRFTGQYHEASLPGGEGLSFYNARWYDPKLGAFLSADSIVPAPLDPQSLNRYAYAGGNPLRFSDPSGHTKLCGAACEDEYKWSPVTKKGGPASKVARTWTPKQATDTRNLDRWLVSEANHLARLPEGKVIKELMGSSHPYDLWTGLYMFNMLVRNGAPLDYKDAMRTLLGRAVQLNGAWYEWSTPGNILYGFYGTAWGINSQLLYVGAGYAQWSDYRNPEPGETPELGPLYPPFYGDTTDDHYAIELGIQLYTQGYMPDQNVTVDEFRALLTDFQHADDMALWTGSIPAAPQNPDWPYSPGYFHNSLNPPTPGWMFPSFD